MPAQAIFYNIFGGYIYEQTNHNNIHTPGSIPYYVSMRARITPQPNPPYLTEGENPG